MSLFLSLTLISQFSNIKITSIFFCPLMVIMSLMNFGLCTVNLRIYAFFNFYFWVFCYFFSYLYWQEEKKKIIWSYIIIIIIIIACEKNMGWLVTWSTQPITRSTCNLCRWSTFYLKSINLIWSNLFVKYIKCHAI